MFIIDWVFDKMGYTKKVHWLTVLNSWESQKPVKKVATKRKSPAKKSQSQAKKV
jgi:hypothetical protein